jgi:hypothetical protein
VIGGIKEKTGYTTQHILWHQPWALFLMEAADAPRYRKGRPPVAVAESADEIENILGSKVKRI